jgi:deoxyribodipyrimidine photolyase
MALVEIKESDRNILTHTTSGLSVRLSSGKLDPRDVLKEINNNLSSRKLKIKQVAYLEALKRQLIFREFARSALEAQKYKFPRGAKGMSSREYKSLIRGDTGIPLIDSCILDLKNGLPHNRARLLLARWAIRNANIDPLLVADFFKQNLTDYSPVINTFNIVSASSGAVFGECFFRTSNPITAAKKLDPDNGYIKKFGFDSQIPDSDALIAMKLGTEFWKHRWQSARANDDFIEKKLWPTKDKDRGIYFILDRIPARGAFSHYYNKYLAREAELLKS